MVTTASPTGPRPRSGGPWGPRPAPGRPRGTSMGRTSTSSSLTTMTAAGSSQAPPPRAFSAAVPSPTNPTPTRATGMTTTPPTSSGSPKTASLDPTRESSGRRLRIVSTRDNRDSSRPAGRGPDRSPGPGPVHVSIPQGEPCLPGAPIREAGAARPGPRRRGRAGPVPGRQVCGRKRRTCSRDPAAGDAVGGAGHGAADDASPGSRPSSVCRRVMLISCTRLVRGARSGAFGGAIGRFGRSSAERERDG